LLVALVAATEATFTVTLNEHDELPQPLVAVHVTEVFPTAKVLPDAGEHVTVGDVPVADGVAKVTTGLQVVMSEGHAPITGGVHPAFTVTLKVHVDVPQLFVAVQVTVVVPALNVLPEAGEQDTVGLGVPLADGVE